MDEIQKINEYIASIPKFAKKTDLNNTRGFLRILGNPQLSYESFHVAGTNGKGSVSKMLSLMLQKAGFKTGLFISPHLIKLNERISIDGTDISDEDLVRIFNRIKNTVDNAINYDDTSDKLVHPAYFEFLFLMACEYFKEKGCDAVVFETGLGGRLDATNVLIPKVSIITSIGMDHMQYLGDTIDKIAFEKAGIIKPGIPVIYNTGSSVADRVIADRCDELCVPGIFAADTDISHLTKELDIDETFLKDIERIIDDFGSRINVPYQKDNAYEAAYAFLRFMLSKDIKDVSAPDKYLSYITDALLEFSFPARMQFIAPNIVIDGAHNEDAVKRLNEAVNNICDKKGFTNIHLLFASADDKDHEEVIRLLCEGLNPVKIYVTELSSGRKSDAKELSGIFKDLTDADIIVNRDIRKAYEKAENGLDEKSLLVIAGSLYLAGEILSLNRKA